MNSNNTDTAKSSPMPDLAYDSYRAVSSGRGIKRPVSSLGVSNGREPSVSRSLNRAVSEGPQHSPMPQGLIKLNTLTGSNSRSIPKDHDETGIHSNPVNNTYGNREYYAENRFPSKLEENKAATLVKAGDALYSLESYSAEILAFWILLAILCILVIGNTILTITLFGVLRIGAGMESIEFFPGALKFFGDTDLDDIFKRDGIIETMDSEPIHMIGEEGGQVNFRIHDGSQPSLSIQRTIINMSQISEFRIRDKKDGKEVFSTNTPTLGLPSGVQKLDVRIVKTNKISSAINDSLQISSTITYLLGSEGTHFDGHHINWKADQDIYLKSINGKVLLQSHNGIYLNVHDLPLVRDTVVTKNSYTYVSNGKKESQYQLCICMPEGKLFRILIPLDNHKRPKRTRIGCHSAINPCSQE